MVLRIARKLPISLGESEVQVIINITSPTEKKDSNALKNMYGHIASAIALHIATTQFIIKSDPEAAAMCIQLLKKDLTIANDLSTEMAKKLGVNMDGINEYKEELCEQNKGLKNFKIWDLFIILTTTY